MDLVFIGLAYLNWHYSSALRNLVQIWSNFVWFIYHFFSLGVLVRTLFSPWRRLDEGYQKGLEPEAWFETLILNTLMRAVGLFIRSIFIILGLAALLVTVALVVPALVVWLLLPPIVAGLFFGGLIFIFQ
jgi:hypothetical protein